MLTNIRVIQSTDFLRATAEGIADLHWAEQVLVGLTARSEAMEGYYAVVIDTRQALGMLSASQLWHLAEKVASYRDTLSPSKTAILCPGERFDHARFFAMCAAHKGYNVRAFTSYGRAMEWCLGAEAD